MSIFIYIFISVVVIYLLQFLLFRFKPFYTLNIAFGLYKNRLQKESNAKILILGTSHGKAHIIPKEIAIQNNLLETDVLNLAKVAASSYETYITYKSNMDKLKSVQKVYITITPHMYCEKFFPYYPYERGLLSKKQWDYLHSNHNSYLKKMHNIEYNYYYFPILAFLRSLKIVKNSIKEHLGYQPRNYKPEKLNRFSKDNFADYFVTPLDIYKPSGFLIESLKKLQDLLKSKDIEVNYILSPTYGQFASLYKTELKEYDELLVKKLNTILGEQVLLGSLDGQSFGLSEYDFYDDTHLTHSGAVKYTRDIFSDIFADKQKSSFKPLYQYKPEYQDTLYNNSYLDSQIKAIISILDNLTNEKKSIIYGNTNLTKLIKLIYPNREFVIVDKSNPSSLEYLVSMKDSDIIIAALGYEEDIANTLKSEYSCTNIVRFDLYDEIDTKYLRVEINTLFTIIKFLKDRYKDIKIVSKDKIYKEIFENIFEPSDIADKYLIVDFAAQKERYKELIDSGISRDDIISLNI
jgi:hypothetical protein